MGPNALPGVAWGQGGQQLFLIPFYPEPQRDAVQTGRAGQLPAEAPIPASGAVHAATILQPLETKGQVADVRLLVDSGSLFPQRPRAARSRAGRVRRPP